MSDNGQAQSDPSVLGALPRTRPQRPSPRRASVQRPSPDQASAQRSSPDQASAQRSSGPTASKASASAKRGATKGRSVRAGAVKRSSAKPSAAETASARRREPPAPRQGYEPMEEPKGGSTVSPPSGAELVESVATIFSELASAGLKAGARVLRDALAPLRRP